MDNNGQIEMKAAPIDVMAYGSRHPGELDASLPGNAERLRESAAMGSRLREAREKNATGKEIIEEASSKEVRFTPDAARALLVRFGADMASENPSDRNSIIISGDAKVEARECFERAKRTTEDVSALMMYSEALQISQATGQTPEEVLESRFDMKPSRSASKWTEIEDRSLGFVLSMSTIHELAPQLRELSTTGKRDFIKRTVIADPKFRTRIGAGIREVQKETSTFEEVTLPYTEEQFNAEKTLFEQQIQERVDNVVTQLTAVGGTIQPAEKDAIRVMLSEGRSAEAVAVQLRQSLLKDTNYSRIADIQSYRQKEKAYVDAQNYANQPTLSTTDRNNAKAHLQAVKTEYEAERGRLIGDNTFVTQYNRYTQLDSLLSADVDKQHNQYISNVMQELQLAKQVGERIAQAQAKRAEETLKPPTRYRNGMANRLLHESDVLDKMEGILPDAITAMLVERYDKMQEINQKDMEQRVENAKTQAPRQITEAIRNNWIRQREKDGKRTINKDRIASDVRVLVYFGEEEGTRRLMLRDLGVANWRTTDLNTLAQDQKAGLDEAMENCRSVYIDKLLGDFFMARGGMDKTVKLSSLFGWEVPLSTTTGRLWLSDQQYRDLHKMYRQRLQEKQQLKGQVGTEDTELIQTGINNNIQPARTALFDPDRDTRSRVSTSANFVATAEDDKLAKVSSTAAWLRRRFSRNRAR